MAVEIVTKSSSIISDAAVLYATWKTSGNIRALSRRVGGARVSLADGMYDVFQKISYVSILGQVHYSSCTYTAFRERHTKSYGLTACA